MAKYALIFLVSFLASLWIFKYILRIAVDKNIVDNPDARKAGKLLPVVERLLSRSVSSFSTKALEAL